MKYLSTLIFILGILTLSNCNEEDQNPPAKPELVSPTDASTDEELDLTFNWNAVNGAKSYGFQLSLSPDFTDTENNTSGIEEVSLSINGLMPSTKYYWRVNAKNANGISPWSDVWELTTRPVGIPTLVAPTNNSIVEENNQTLEWNSIVGANTYTLQVSLAPDFASTILNQENLVTISFDIENLEWTTIYYWRVKASINSCYSEWSEVWNFTPKRPIPSTGLVAYYPFNGNVNDESGNSHNGTLQGATLANDRNGNTNKAYSFDGVDDYISVPHHEALNLIGNFTISVWYNSDGCLSPCGTYHTIINKRDESVAGDNWPWGVAISYVDGPKGEFQKIFSSRRNNSNMDYQVSDSEILLNTWQHVIIVVQDNVQSIYINGEFDSSFSFVQAQPASTENMLIGWNLRPDLEQFKGLIDDIRLYSRALTIEEMLALFQE